MFHITADNYNNEDRFCCSYNCNKIDCIVKSICNFLQIKAIEITDETRTGEAEVNVKLRDLNDESPIFEQEEYVFAVVEHTPIGTHIGFVKANDQDAFDTVT